MDSLLFSRLVSLPRLDRNTFNLQSKTCKICGGVTQPFDVVDLNKCASLVDFYAFGLSGVSIPYSRCRNCGFLGTVFFDDWTPANFASFIYNEDYVKVDPEYISLRPRRTAEFMSSILATSKSSRILDYGSGLGEFADNMAGFGFSDVVSYDPFSNPTRPSGLFDVITCFEVIEHSVAPQQTFADICQLLKADGLIVLSQCLQPQDIERVRGNWWYLAPRNGHVSTFTKMALGVMASQCGKVLHCGENLYAFRGSEPSEKALAAAMRVGSPSVTLRLGAPQTSSTTAWFEIEGVGAKRFRWTRSERISWSTILPTGVPKGLRIEIPFLMGIKQGFASACKVFVNELSLPCIAEGNSIVAEGAVKMEGLVQIDLHLPPHISPEELRGEPDSRKLGLAIYLE